MIKEVLERWGTKIPETERFVVYFLIPCPDGVIKLMSLGQVLTLWDSNIESCIEEALESPDEYWDLDSLMDGGCDLILEQTKDRARLIPSDVLYILNHSFKADMATLYAELKEDGHLANLIRDKMEDIFFQCLKLLKDEINEYRNCHDRELVEQNS